ncbi:MAG: hypothetical protein GY822_00495 [Deltaproteobacteria bacterium]|nr:hypothetical protein [Deltaproteobacteria bacterium]
MLAVFLVAFSKPLLAAFPIASLPVCLFATMRKGQAIWQLSFDHDDGDSE